MTMNLLYCKLTLIGWLLPVVAWAQAAGNSQAAPTLLAPPPAPISSDLPLSAPCPLEDYPPAAIRAEATGTSRLQFTLDARGFLIDTRILRSAGASREHKLLDAASVRSLWRCFFRADRQGLERTFVVETVWRLDERPSSAAQ